MHIFLYSLNIKIKNTLEIVKKREKKINLIKFYHWLKS